VDDRDYQPPFRFTGKIDKLTVKLGQLSAGADNETVEKKKRNRR
jgi:hypothetical protein